MKFECKHNKSPILYIQSDWHEVLRETNGKVWISCKYKDEPGIYGSIQKYVDEEGVSSFKVTDGFIIEKLDLVYIQIKHIKSSVSTYFLAPKECLSNLHEKSISSLCVSSNGVGVSCSSDDSPILWNAQEGTVKQKLDGHVGEVYKCRFFPSGEVVLTGGSDMSLKIWCAKTGRCPVTLVGHTMAVTDMAFVDRGKNVLSCSKDGYLKLWNCADATCIYNIIKVHATINTCAICEAADSLDLGHPNHQISDKEVNTDNKIVVLGCEDGIVHCVALKSHKKLFTIDTGSAVNSVCFINRLDFVIGCQDGSLYLFNVTSPKQPIYSWNDSNSAVLSLLEYYRIGFFVSRTDGCVEFIFIQGNPLLKISLTGSDCDPIYDLSMGYDDILYTCCRDSKIRSYHVRNIIADISSLHLTQR